MRKWWKEIVAFIRHLSEEYEKKPYKGLSIKDMDALEKKFKEEEK